MNNLTRVFHSNVAAYYAGKKIIINQGGTSCFSGDQLVITQNGSVPICSVNSGDKVKTFNEQTGKEEFREVKNRLVYKNQKPTVRIKMKNGKTITGTDDHKFYFEGGWHSIKHILYEWVSHSENIQHA